jgi:hypothetical protein
MFEVSNIQMLAGTQATHKAIIALLEGMFKLFLVFIFQLVLNFRFCISFLITFLLEMASSCSKDDLLLFYISGHGACWSTGREYDEGKNL